jgi:hypothetical protein
LCSFVAGPIHFTLNNQSYFYSGNETEYADSKVNWLDARNICREYCMDLVSIETPSEDNMISEYIKKGLSIKNDYFVECFILLKFIYRGHSLHLDLWKIV